MLLPFARVGVRKMADNRQLGLAQWRQYPFWARGPARIVGDPVDGEIVLDEGRAEPYYMDKKDLSFEFARLAFDLNGLDTRDVVAFVRRYGLLWHGAKDLDTGECRESLMEFWYESRVLAVLMQLYADLREALRSSSTDKLRTTMQEVLKIFEAAPLEEDDQTLMDQASVYLAEFVTMKLEGCSFGLTSSIQLDGKPRGPDVFLVTHRPPNLLAAAYVHFAQTIASRAPMEECPGCGRMFVQESGKQKYCTPSCASTSRWRRWKERQDVPDAHTLRDPSSSPAE